MGTRLSEPEEQELLRRARAGERGAFDRLQKGLEMPVRRFLWRLIGQSPAEEDIVRGVFLALYLNLDRLNAPERLRPFLFRVVRNQCYDELRRQGRFQVVSLDEEREDAASPAATLRDGRPQPDEAAHWTLLYAQVQKAIDRLPELQRQALLLYGEENLCYAEIAEIMATDVGTVKSRIHHARRSLTRRLPPETLDALGVKPDAPGVTKEK